MPSRRGVTARRMGMTRGHVEAAVRGGVEHAA